MHTARQLGELTAGMLTCCARYRKEQLKLDFALLRLFCVWPGLGQGPRVPESQQQCCCCISCGYPITQEPWKRWLDQRVKFGPCWCRSNSQKMCVEVKLQSSQSLCVGQQSCPLLQRTEVKVTMKHFQPSPSPPSCPFLLQPPTHKIHVQKSD